MSKKVRFIPYSRRLEFIMPKTLKLPAQLLRTLREESVVLDYGVQFHRRDMLLYIELHNPEGLPPFNQLERLAYWLSRVPGYRGVYDPWERGINHVNLKLALELIDDVFRNFGERQLAA